MFQIVFRNQFFVLVFFQIFNQIPANVASGNAGLFESGMDHFYQVAPPLFDSGVRPVGTVSVTVTRPLVAPADTALETVTV